MSEQINDYIDVAAVSELPAPGCRAYSVDGRKIVIVRTAAGVYALDNACPHRGGPLAEGDVIGSEIVCPWHLWGFDVATGICGGNPDVRVVTHDVRLAGDRLLVKLTPQPQESNP
jgi:nitrite reductase/ring-hydroxylating ferredoxin subunit